MKVRSESRRIFLGAAAILLASLAAYSPALSSGFIWDDDDYVTANPVLRTTEGLARIWTSPSATHQFYPMVHSSFWLEFQLWGLNPFGYHLVNVLLHSANACLFWVILQRLAVPGAFFAALVFAIHPVHVESVAWITERKNVLSGLFYLASLLVCLKLFLPPPASPGGKKKSGRESTADTWNRKTYLLSLVLFIFALLSKTVTCSLPAALVLLLLWKRESITRLDAARLTPFFLIGGAMGLTTAWLERHQVGAAGAEWALSFLDRTLIAGRALWFYAGKLLFPSNLTFFYPRWKIDSGEWWQLLFPISAGLVFVLLWLLRGRLGKAPLAGMLIFAGTLVPALGFFDVYPMRFSFVADHFQYHASLGFIALACAGAVLLIRNLTSGAGIPEKTAIGVLCAVLGVLTWNQAGAYHDLESLYRDTLAKNPEAWMAHQNLGAVMIDRGELAEGITHIREAVRLKPNEAAAYSLLGLACYRMSRLAEAEANYQRALRLDPEQADALNNLAWLRATHSDPRFHDPTTAIQLAERACGLAANKRPEYIDTLAAAYASAGRFEDAIRAGSKAVELALFFGQDAQAREYRHRVELYRAGSSFRDSRSEIK